MFHQPNVTMLAQHEDELQRIRFTVDSALLRELGERLVGKSHIALAELVKNSYDADATKVIIRFGPGRIEVADNGHGMNFTEFRDFWMRVGSPHKQTQRVSRYFRRPMTGSKGIGRLAVQFLARQLRMYTVSKEDPDSELEARVNWDEAARVGDLVEAEALYREIAPTTGFPEDSRHGMAIILSGLNQSWTSDDILELAKEIWWLQPPFRSNPSLSTDQQKAFVVELESPNEKAVRAFDSQMRAILDIWYARVFGKLIEVYEDDASATGTVQLVLEFSDETRTTHGYSIPDCNLHHEVEFEIRIFKLHYRQPRGIKVGEARGYFNKHGGIHVYDAGFHMPYYGPEHDWLGIEMDHSHRLSRSQLLPDGLQVPEGLTFLPTTSRMFGVVHVNTNKDEEAARREHPDESEYLKIQVSRDRLVGNEAYQDLRNTVRWALDFYAMQEARRQFEEASALRSIEPAREKFERVDQVLTRYRRDIPEPIYNTLRVRIQEAIVASETEAEVMVRQVGLLGSLATAGMSALAYEHEVQKQYVLLEEVAEQLAELRIRDRATRERLNKIVASIDEWLRRARATRRLFSHLLDEEDREVKARFKARELVRDVTERMGILLRGVEPALDGLDDSLLLPEGGFAEWSAIFQNVFVNAVNAMLDSPTKRIAVSSRAESRGRFLLIQDTGVGMDLAEADELFKPFERRLDISPERRALGLGGSGLGLTIVRMIAGNLGCKVSFVKPEEGFSTAFQISWREG